MPRAFGTTNAAPYASAPAVGAAGDTYFNTTSKTLYLSDGTQWIQVQGGGGSTSVGYWSSRITYNTSLAAGVTTSLPLDTPVLAQGFTRSGVGGAQCTLAGKYAAIAGLTLNEATASNGPCWCTITQMRGGSQIAYWDAIQSGNPNPYVQIVTAGEFDMLVGDELRVSASSPNASSVLTQSNFIIIPLSGSKGDKGDSGTVYNEGFNRYSTVATTVGASAQVDIPLASTLEAYGTAFTPNGTNTRFTIPADGVYNITAVVAAYSSTMPGGNSYMGIMSTNIGMLQRQFTQGKQYETCVETIQRYLLAGDQIGMCYFNGTGASWSLPAGIQSGNDGRTPMLSIWRAGAGQRGLSLNVKGTVANYAALPSSGNQQNDTWITQDTQKMYVWNGTTWVDAGSVISGGTAPYIYTSASGPAGNLPASAHSTMTWLAPIRSNQVSVVSGSNITFATAGRYNIIVQAGFYASNGNVSRVDVNIYQFNSSGQQKEARRILGNAGASGYNSAATAEAVLDIAAGDYVQVTIYPFAANLQLDFNGQFCYLSAIPVGGAKGDKGDSGGPVPTGGKAFQVLTKQSATDGDTIWRTPPVLGGNPTWRLPTQLNNGWSNYGGTFQVAAYARKNGVVYVRGLISKSSPGTAVNQNIFGLEAGYLPFSGNGGYGTAALRWVPAGNGNQLMRLDLTSGGSPPSRGGGYLGGSDQTGGGYAQAGWASLEGVSWMLDELGGIESGYEIIANADGTVFVNQGVCWINGARYESDPVTLPNLTGTVRIVFVCGGRYGSTLPTLLVGQWADSSESWAKVNASSNGYGNDGSYNFGLHLIATRTSGTWADRREWA